MYKLLILAFTLLNFSDVRAENIVYIGDFYKKDINSYQPISANEIKIFMENHPFNKRDIVVTNAGLNLSCSNYKTVQNQLELLKNKVSKIYLVKNYSCFGVNTHLKLECAKIKKCKLIEPYNIYQIGNVE